MNYYLDESGNTGDLINKKNDMSFSKQPIFTHSCIGINEEKIHELNDFIINLKKRHNIDETIELKSQDYYIKNPKLVYEVIEYIIRNNLPIVCEVMDKKYNVAVSIVNHLIVPTMGDESNGEAQYIRIQLSDFISTHAPDTCFTSFSELCKNPNEKKLLECFNILKNFFELYKNRIDDDGYTILMIDETLDDYYIYKNRLGEEAAVKMFVPIPDLDSNGNIIKLLPNVHSFYNQLARLNKIHNKKLNTIKLIHDTSSEFSKTLQYCIDNIKTVDTKGMPNIPTCDYNVTDSPELIFKDSRNSIGIQVADILAGFLNRYIYGLLYKKINMDEIYHKTFREIIYFNRYRTPIGINFVLPISKLNSLFKQFGL
ncbi:DUF3800 domain-containing protein [Klebsiella aerogenes]|uniref:DUF3800 domain-containing protein n=1 Tax=Klebsiella aerogenes TaxID=548 RepID=UPI0018673A12|nr:DUF3800 domain-containing protein [Klebsiella aerogenes]